MEANQTSMKRRRPLSLMGICKSQIHLCRTRSGRVINTDGQPNILSSESHPKRPRSIDPTQESPDDGNEFLNILIKDLRTKRVFSPISKPSKNVTNHHKLGAEFGFHEPDEGFKKAKSDGVESSGNGFSCSGREYDSESEGTEKSESGFVSDAKKSDDVSPKSPVREVVAGSGRTCNVEHSGGGGQSKQECAQTSPPEVKANGVGLNVYNKTKLVLKPRQRVFKAPGSFGYRRLLPYLKDITKDDSCMLDFCEQPKLHKGLEGTPFKGTMASEIQDGSIHQLNAHNFSRECRTSDSCTLVNTVHVSSLDTSNVNELSLESSAYAPKAPSATVVDECLSKPTVDEQIKNFDLGFSCKVQRINVLNPLSCLAVEDSQVNKDHANGMHTDDNTPVENVETADKADNEFSCEAQNAKDISPKSSSIMDECYSSTDNEVGKNQNSNQSLSEGVRKIDMGYPCEEQNANHTNEQRVGKVGEVLDQMDDSNEECVQMTPPDPEILSKLEVEVKRISRARYVLQNTNQGLGRSNEFNHKVASWVDFKRQESTPKRKLVLNPCSRLKLFRSPGSVSYRRLLPFLMDMEKSAPGNVHCANTDKDLEQKLLPSLTSDLQETPSDKSNGTQPIPQVTTVDGSSSDDVPNLTSHEQVTEFQSPFHLQKEQHVEQAVSGKQIKLETSPDIRSSESGTDPPVKLLCPLTCEAPSTKDGAVSITNSLTIDPEEDYISSRTELSNGGKSVQVDGLCQNSSQNDATVSSGIHAVGLRKGILKRNPRGCRGLCTCLNCASFRLHAERAFEFSRNQMQDAEEVALDLMKELSKLCKILEKSAAGATNHVVNLNEVKEACRKAYEAEDLARNRLGEMNYDLNIHCRVTCLHEPRVTFANHTEEKVIPKADFPSN